MSERLFAYGTLEVAEVLEPVAGVRLASRPAVLPGFARYRVRGAGYPGVVEDPEVETPGTLYENVGPEALRRIDRFEGPLYERRRVRVRLEDATSADALVYVIRADKRHVLSREPWDPARFAASARGGRAVR